jgi:hypothetical protein
MLHWRRRKSQAVSGVGASEDSASVLPTTVTVYEGEHAFPPHDVRVLYVATAPVDRDSPLLQQASDVLRAVGYSLPLGPYSAPCAFSVFVHSESPKCPSPKLEASVHIAVAGESVRVRVRYGRSAMRALTPTAVERVGIVASIARKAISRIRWR